VDKRIVSGVTVLCLIFGTLDAVFVWQDWTIRSSASATPQDITLADLAARGPGANKHVRVTDAHFGKSYAVETKNGKPNRAWIPLVAPPDGAIKVVVKTFNADDAALDRLARQTTVTGIITNDIHSIGSSEMGVLKQAYPGADFDNVLVLEEGREFPSTARLYALLGGALLLYGAALVSGVMWFVAVRRERRGTGAAADSAAKPGEVPPSAAGLGEFQRSYTAAPTVRKILIGGGFFLILLAGAGVMALVNTKPADLPVGIAVLGGLAALLGAAVAFGIWRVRGEVLLFADGLIVKRGGEERVCHWDDVEALTGMVATTNQFGMRCYVGGPLVLTRRDGRRITISDGLQDSVQLGEVITAEVLKRRLPEARAALERGDTVTVGPLRVDRLGLAQGDGDALPWGDVEEVTVVDDLLVIRRAGSPTPWFKGKLEKTPNAVLVLDLAGELQQQAGSP
jgi:hypothetical protein